MTHKKILSKYPCPVCGRHYLIWDSHKNSRPTTTCSTKCKLILFPTLGHTLCLHTGNLSEVQRAWLACAVDGEGMITLGSSGHTAKYLSPIVGVTNTEKQFVMYCQQMVGSGRCRTYSNHKFGKKTVNSRMMNEWRLTAIRDVQNILVQILPHLVIKERQAKLVLQYIEWKLACRGQNETMEQLKIVEELRELNTKGHPRFSRILRAPLREWSEEEKKFFAQRRWDESPIYIKTMWYEHHLFEILHQQDIGVSVFNGSLRFKFIRSSGGVTYPNWAWPVQDGFRALSQKLNVQKRRTGPILEPEVVPLEKWSALSGRFPVPNG